MRQQPEEFPTLAQVEAHDAHQRRQSESVETRRTIESKWLDANPKMHAARTAEIDALMQDADGIGGIIWGAEFRKRTHGGLDGNECVVCGRDTSGKGTYIWASPASGKAIPATVAQLLPDWYEASGYPVGSDCLRRNPALNRCVQQDVR